MYLSDIFIQCFDTCEQESTCEMKRAIEARDRKLSVLNEKLNSHLSLFDSILLINPKRIDRQDL